MQEAEMMTETNRAGKPAHFYRLPSLWCYRRRNTLVLIFRKIVGREPDGALVGCDSNGEAIRA